MRSRLLFREHGQVIPTVRPLSAWLQDIFAVAAAAALVVALLAWGLAVDEQAHAEDLALAAAEARGFEAGRMQALDEAGQRVRNAYAAGVRDGVEGASGTPGGLRFAQACLAARSPAGQRQ